VRRQVVAGADRRRQHLDQVFGLLGAVLGGEPRGVDLQPEQRAGEVDQDALDAHAARLRGVDQAAHPT